MMPEGIITIFDGSVTRQAALDPKGVIIGRSPSCGLVLEGPLISRQHARLSQDPFGRWIIEDLGSRNGVLVDGRPIKACPLGPNDSITIGNFTLRLGGAVADADATTRFEAPAVMDDLDQTQVTLRTFEQHAQASLKIKHLNEITDSLLAVTAADRLYPQTCRLLAQTRDSVALALRVPRTGDFAAPQMLACCVSGFEPAASPQNMPHNLHVSRRVMEAVRTTGSAAMAGSITEANLLLTVMDERRPRAVFCAPVSESETTVELLYLDSPADTASGETLDLVQAIARQVGMVRKGLLLADERAQRAAIDRQLAMAREIQAKLTPPPLVRQGPAEVAVHYEPAMWVGGDYCDVWELGPGRLALALGDVSGKGLPAAMVMTNLQAALRTTMAFCDDLSVVMHRLSQHLETHLPDGMFVTMLLGVYDVATRRLDYVNAGHILPFVRSDSGLTQQIGKPSNPPLGIAPAPFEAESLTLAPGQAWLAVSDGITESAAPDKSLLGEPALADALSRHPARSGPELVAAVTATATAFRQSRPQQDDITVLALVAG